MRLVSTMLCYNGRLVCEIVADAFWLVFPGKKHKMRSEADEFIALYTTPSIRLSSSFGVESNGVSRIKLTRRHIGSELEASNPFLQDLRMIVFLADVFEELQVV